MATTCVKARILPILYEKIASYIANYKKLSISKNQLQIYSIFQQPMVKNVQNLMIFNKIIAYLWNQLKKVENFRKSDGEKKILFRQPVAKT